MLSGIKGVRAALGYSSLFVPALMPKPGCLNMDQSPVVLSAEHNTPERLKGTTPN